MTKINKELEKFIPTANLIAKTFGRNCEVVLHDLTTPQYSVVYTINNHVTGREVGESFDHLIKSVLLSKNFKEDHTVNYLTETSNGKKIKSSTALIRDSQDKVVGALCVNYDFDNIMDFKSLMDEFMTVSNQEIEPEVEPFENVMEIVDNLIDEIVDNNIVDNLSKKEKINLVEFMDKKGIFLMKGAIDKVAEKLNISKVTIYSYLDEIKKKEDE